MKVVVHSKYPLSTTEKRWITNIFFEEQDVDEALYKAFGARYHHLFMGEPIEIFLDSADGQFIWQCEV